MPESRTREIPHVNPEAGPLSLWRERGNLRYLPIGSPLEASSNNLNKAIVNHQKISINGWYNHQNIGGSLLLYSHYSISTFARNLTTVNILGSTMATTHSRFLLTFITNKFGDHHKQIWGSNSQALLQPMIPAFQPDCHRHWPIWTPGQPARAPGT